LNFRPDSQILIFELLLANLPPDSLKDSHISYINVGLGYPSTPNPYPTEWTFKSLKMLMIEHNHKYIDVLKMDIEGHEYAFLENEKDILERVGQLLLEIHIHVPLAKTPIVDLIDTIESKGLRLFHQEINIHKPYFCSEYSFIRKDWLDWNQRKYDFQALTP
jgi:hypothetical protein